MPLGIDRQVELNDRARANRAADNRGYATERSYGPAGSVTEQGRQATRNIQSAYDDYRDTGNTGLEDIGNFLARSFGVRERNPLKDPTFDPYSQNQANYGFSPLGAIAGIAGTALGVPGLGAAVGLLDDYVLDRPFDIPLGQQALGGGTTGFEDQSQQAFAPGVPGNRPGTGFAGTPPFAPGDSRGDSTRRLIIAQLLDRGGQFG